MAKGEAVTKVGRIKIVGHVPTDAEILAALGYRTAPQKAQKSHKPKKQRTKMTAKFDTRCDVCDWPILMGTSIKKDSFGSWVHELCAP